MEDVAILGTYTYGHLVYFTTIWYILWPFGLYGSLEYVFPILYGENSGNPAESIN
jgi:hypothetical protein